MITFDTFLLGLMVVSVATGFTTEGIKMLLSESNKTCHPNILSSIVSVVLSIFAGIGYVVFVGMEFTAQTVICIAALAFMSWLCAMLGYDKVVGAFNINKKGE